MTAADGRLWLPIESGIAVVQPDAVEENRQPPSVWITRIQLDGHSVAALNTNTFPVGNGFGQATNQSDVSASLELPPSHQEITVEFTATSFASPRNIGFKCKLEGLDRDWVDMRGQRSITYRHLPADNYRFRVIACNSSGIWNETGAGLDVRVLPYFWNTWWFRTIVGAAVVIFVAVTVRWLEKRKMQRRLEASQREKAIERERARIAKDIHDDMGANLTEITLLSELAQGEDAPDTEVREDIRRIAARARELTRSVDATVWAVNPIKDSLESLISYTCSFAEDYLKSGDIKCRIEVPANIPRQTIPPEVRHNIYLAFKEALNNVVKHAEAREVRLKISLSGNVLKFVLEDDGRGFNLQSLESELASKIIGPIPKGRRGYGLLNMRQRIEGVGGHYTLTSSKSGTRIEFAIELKD